MDEELYYLGFSVFSGIGPARFKLLLNHFGHASEAWSAPVSELEKAGLGEILSAKFAAFRSEFSPRDYRKKLFDSAVSFVPITNLQYPKQLAKIKNPPIGLYVKGNQQILDDENKTVAVVGTRKMTQYGRDVTELFTKVLVAEGMIIVSGLALGVDGLAHQTAIENNGRTIAVLGCGVDCVTPVENTNLYKSILEKNGCVVSEVPLGHRPSPGLFPARNRIVAGISTGVLVTEGAEDSGSLITARFALSQKKQVFVVPGAITSNYSKGPFALLKEGAILVTEPGDILSELKLQIQSAGRQTKSQINSKLKNYNDQNLSKDEERVLELLENEAMGFDEIIRVTAIAPAKLGSILSMMELKGMIRILESGEYTTRVMSL